MKKINNKTLLLVFCIIGLSLAATASAYVMGSNNYRIQFDSINSGGSEIGSSANYNLSDTVGEVGTGDMSSTNYAMHAGYRQMNESYISLTIPGSVSMSPNISGVVGGIANGNDTWTVKTDSPAGYNLYIKAANSPAMTSGANYFADYTPVGASIPDYDWNILSANSEFGFSPYNPISQASRFKNNGVDCASGSNVIDGDCWYGLATSNVQIVNSVSATPVAGENTKINFRAEVRSSNGFQIAGSYNATVVITAIAN